MKALIIAILVPGLLLYTAIRFARASTYGHAAAPDPTVTTILHTLPKYEEAPQSMAILVSDGDKLLDMDLEEYLVGVVLAEMPASFEMEALKAQAVAARTYAIRCCTAGRRHGENTVCTNYACCQAYIHVEDYLGTYGTKQDIEKVRSAVYQTAGQVLLYDGELIDAVFFSSSGGMTEAAVAVWGYEIPYLQSVSSPGEEKAAAYSTTIRFTPQEFCDALGVRLSGTPNTWFGEVTYTAGGGVASMQIGNVAYRGTTLRKLFGLKSTIFCVYVEDDGTIAFTTSGFGHRVGMSQYGADAMATTGSSYEEILKHYYVGTSLAQYLAR